jgi:hypothetical protein
MKAKNKTYIIKKNDDYNDRLDIKEYFEKPDKFLIIDPKIYIGAFPYQINKNNRKDDIKDFQSLNNSKNIKKSKNNKISRLSLKSTNSLIKSPRKDFYLSPNKVKDLIINNKNKYSITDRIDHSKNIHYKLKSFNDLKHIFIDSLEREKISKLKGTDSLIPLKTDINIKKKFIDQEKKLKYNLLYKSNSEKYIKNLAKKCKKNKGEMLLNNIQNYRMTKQIKDYLENKKTLSEKLGDNYWIFNLRRPSRNIHTKLNYFNIGATEKEIWKRYMDYPDKDIELVKLPNNKEKRNKHLFTDINKKNNENIFLYHKIEEFNDIKIIGKNLAKKEYKDIVDVYNTCKNNSVKFRVYKDPKENDKNYVKDLVYKELYQLKKNKKNKREKIKLKLIK